MVLGLWALLTVHGQSVVGWGSNFPLKFEVVDLDFEVWGPGEVPGWSILGVRAFLVDTSLALAVSWASAMAVDRLVFPLVRGQSTKTSADASISWPSFLPRLPALLLIPAFVFIWASLLWGPETSRQGYERGFPLVFEVYRPRVVWDPLRLPKTWAEKAQCKRDRSEFRVLHFLFDLAIALVVAYLLAMAVDRLLFPLARRLHRKRPEQGEPG